MLSVLTTSPLHIDVEGPPLDGATLLPDDRILSWDQAEEVVKIWDGTSGELQETIPCGEVRARDPTAWWGWREAQGSRRLRQQGAWGVTGQGFHHLDRATSQLTTVPWHSNGRWRACALQPDGLAMLLLQGNWVFLHLYHGNRRVALEQATLLLEQDAEEDQE